MLEIIRIEETKHDGTFGILLVDGECFCLTLERPSLCNQRNISSIPRGNYRCKLIISPTFGAVYEIMDVPGRSHILIHVGNTMIDTDGCVLIAERFGMLAGRRAILNSRATFDRFMRRMRGIDETDITIRECYV